MVVGLEVDPIAEEPDPGAAGPESIDPTIAEATDLEAGPIAAAAEAVPIAEAAGPGAVGPEAAVAAGAVVGHLV